MADWTATHERAFKHWYAGWVNQLAKMGHELNPDPSPKLHKYDYRAAFRHGAGPDVSGRWPSRFKLPFDPEGEGYDTATAQQFIDKWPLTIPKPTKYRGDYVTDKDKESFQSWVWHPERDDYVKHSGSLDPRTGMVLKGRQSSTWNLTEEEEIRLGNKIIKKKDGRYYSVPRKEK